MKKSKLKPSDISSPHSHTFQHKFGIPNDPSKNVFDDPDLIKSLLDLAGLKEDVLQNPGQKKEIEQFCIENDMISRLMSYLTSSANSNPNVSVSTTTWYVDIGLSYASGSYDSGRACIDSFDNDENITPFGNEKSAKVKKHKPPIPPKPAFLTTVKASNKQNIRKIKIVKKPICVPVSSCPPPKPSNPKPNYGGTYGSAMKPPPPPLSTITNTKSTYIKTEPSRNNTNQRKGNPKRQVPERSKPKQIEKRESRPKDIHNALVAALLKINNHVQNSDSSSDDSEYLSDRDFD